MGQKRREEPIRIAEVNDVKIADGEAAILESTGSRNEKRR